MSLKGIEEPAAELLEQWLLAHGRAAKWKPVEDDPPDIAFDVDGLGAWAVEVTEMQEYYGQRTEQDVKQSEAIGARLFLQKLAERVEKLFVNRELSFCYFLYLGGPLNKSQAKEVERDVVTFVESRREGKMMLCGGPSFIEALPLSNGLPGKIYHSFGLEPLTIGGDGKSYLADIWASHSASINRILQAKLPKLGKLTGYDRRVLLIWDSYYFGDEQMVSQLLEGTDLPPSDIDCIFFVDDHEVFLVANPGGVLI